MRYFILRDPGTLEVFLSEELDEQPDNSLPFYPNSLRNARFDCYPNPTCLLGSEQEELAQAQIAVNEIYQIIESNNLEIYLVDGKGNSIEQVVPNK